MSAVSSMREEIKTLKSNQQKMESLLKKLIGNQIEIEENGRKCTKRVGEDFPRLEKEPRPSDEQNTLSDKTKTSIPAFQHVVTVGKRQFFLMLP